MLGSWKLLLMSLEPTPFRSRLSLGAGAMPLRDGIRTHHVSMPCGFTIASKRTIFKTQRVLYFNSVTVILNKLYILTNSIVQILSYSMKSCFIPTILHFTLLEVSIPQGKGSIF